MTHEQKIEAISNKIREALPYLMELKKGCLITVKEHPNVVIELMSNDYPNKCNACTLDGKYIVIDFDDAWGSYNTATHKSTIGKEPLLNDVLAWLMKNRQNTASLILFNGHFYDYNDDLTPIFQSWNLEKPYLKDQSEELIGFLYSLIE